MMRVDLRLPVLVKTLAIQKRRAQNVLQEKVIAIENDIRGMLRNFGLKVCVVGAAKLEARIIRCAKTFLSAFALAATVIF
jgi:transposase